MRTEPAENLDLLMLAYHIGLLASHVDSTDDAEALYDALQQRDWVRLMYTVGNNACHDEEIADLIKELITDDA